MKVLYRDEPPIRFWHAKEFASVQDILEHVASGGAQVVAQASAPSKSGEAGVPGGAPLHK